MDTKPCATIKPDTLDVQPTHATDDGATTIGTPGAYGKEAERRLTRIRERDNMHCWQLPHVFLRSSTTNDIGQLLKEPPMTTDNWDAGSNNQPTKRGVANDSIQGMTDEQDMNAEPSTSSASELRLSSDALDNVSQCIPDTPFHPDSSPAFRFDAQVVSVWFNYDRQP